MDNKINQKITQTHNLMVSFGELIDASFFRLNAAF